MATARIVLITVPTAADTTHFNIQYSANADDWSDYYTTGATLEDLAVAVLSSGVYTLDGINSPTGTKAAASYLGNWYRVRLKNAGGYGNWSEAFRVSAYPTATDLQAFLAAHGFTLTSGQEVQCGSAMEAAIAEFERATDRRPVLAGPSIAKQYDPPTTYLDGVCTLFLGRDLATLTSLTYQPTGASAATTYTRGTDFQLLSYDADDTDEARSFDRVVFYNRRWVAPLPPSQRRSLTITGTWGFSTSVPSDIFAAMLARGAWGMWSQATYTLTGGRLSWKEQDVTEDFGIQTQTALRDAWDEQFKASVRRYRRLTL